MIDRIQSWLDSHPRICLSASLAAGVVASLFALVVGMTAFGALAVIATGALLVSVSFLIVFLSGDMAGSLEAIAAAEGKWMVLLGLGAIAGMIVGGVRTLHSVLRTDPDEYRDRTVLVRDLVAQAVVAQRTGATNVGLRGFTFIGDIRLTYSWAHGDGRSDTDRAFDLLTVQLANPSLTATDYRGDDQRRTWFAVITETAEEIIIRRAVEGSTVNDAASLIANAAQRARMILAETPDPVLKAVEAELCAAGRVRSARLRTLLGPESVEDHSEADPQLAGP